MHDIWNLGTDARNAPRDVRIVICTSLIECVIKMEAISTVQRMVPLSFTEEPQGKYKVQSGEMIRVCMTSDFFLAEADEWRPEAWTLFDKDLMSNSFF